MEVQDEMIECRTSSVNLIPRYGEKCKSLYSPPYGKKIRNKILVLFQIWFNIECQFLFKIAAVTLYRVRVATMTHFCTFGTVTPVPIIGCGWFLKSIDLEVKQLWCKFQAHCLTLTLEWERNMKTFFVSWWQITSHNDDTHLKSIKNSEATMTQLAKNFHTKRFCTSDRNVTFVVLFQFLFTMIVYRK